MKNILLIGIGGTGSRAAEIFQQKVDEMRVRSGDDTGKNIKTLVFDTDVGDAQRIKAATAVSMADTASVGTICDRLGAARLRKWFPSDNNAVRAQEMVRGASQWRKKSYLAFLNLMNKPSERQKFIRALEGMVADPSAACEIYIIASIAGGTGSGSFIPIALYAKRYLRKYMGKDPIVTAMIALPDIYAGSQTAENRIKVYSNAYAILRELNAINLVSRNYNEGKTTRKKAPIDLVIGDPEDPNVGVLFDAADPQFWTPEAAPFSQVFLLDRVPGLETVVAHDIVLANSLYTILCTEIGAAFESEMSNHELLRSQNNGSNAIYAGISTSQIRFPRDAVLDYLAHEKTLESTENEWLVLHKAVQQAISRKKAEQAEMGIKRFSISNEEYANIVLRELDALEMNGNTSVVDLVERATAILDKDRRKTEETTASLFSKRLVEAITEKIDSPDSFKLAELLTAFTTVEKGAKVTVDDVVDAADSCGRSLLDYFIHCVSSIKTLAPTTADSVITLDKRKDGFYGKKLSLVDNVLCKDGVYLHPVVAMVQLCRLRQHLVEDAKIEDGVDWPELMMREVSALPTWAKIKAEPDVATKGKSAYYGMDEDRFRKILGAEGREEYKKAKTNPRTDMAVMSSDVVSLATKIYERAKDQFRYRVVERLIEDIDLLIKKYDSFFARFEKEKEDLVEMVKTARKKNVGQAGSVLNVYSSEKDKRAVMDTIFGESSVETEDEIDKANGVVGIGAWDVVRNAAAAERYSDGSWDEKDSAPYRDLFSRMVAAYSAFIRKTEVYGQIASYNAIEAIVASAGGHPGSKEAHDALRLNLSKAQELAIPSLRVDRGDRAADLVNPSDVVVFMMSRNTARYIKKHADEFGVSVGAEAVQEDEIAKACAENFIHNFSGLTSARISIVDNMPDQVLYCTGEILDITPLRIDKFDEMGRDPLYFSQYCIALENLKKYETDMWNPHLGFDLHKRGHLPYMNERKERECDERMVKALIYAFGMGEKRLITLADGVGMSSGKYFFYYNGQRIQTANNEYINTKNIAKLFAWLRNEEELVREWSDLFDAEIERQKNALPSLASDNGTEISKLEGALTKSRFMDVLTSCLYEDKSGAKYRVIDAKGNSEKRNGPSLLEFAYMVKTSEECDRDCDDAERILRVAYNVFKEMCEHRANPETYADRFIQIYKHELDKIYDALAYSSVVVSADSNCKAHYDLLADWLNKTGVFNTIAEDTTLDASRQIRIATPYVPTAASQVEGILKSIEDKRGSRAKKTTDDGSDAAE